MSPRPPFAATSPVPAVNDFLSSTEISSGVLGFPVICACKWLARPQASSVFLQPCTPHDVKNPRKDSLSECEIFEGFRNTLFVQSGRSNRCRLRSQFKPPITAVDYGLGRDSGDNNKGMATVPGPWRASVEHHHAAPGLPPSARSSPGFMNCVDSHIRNRPWSLLCVYQAGLGGHPHPPTPRSPGPEALG